MQLLDSQFLLMVSAIMTFILGSFLLLRSKHPLIWFVVIVTIFIILACIFLHTKKSSWAENLSPNIPKIFIENNSEKSLGRWLVWMGSLALSTMYMAIWLYKCYFSTYAIQSDSTQAESSFLDLKQWWDEIVSVLDSKNDDWRYNPVFLVLTDTEEQSRRIFGSEKLKMDYQIPHSPSAPIHAYSDADATYISVGLACCYGLKEESAEKRLAWLCSQISQLNIELPVLKGINILMPFDQIKSRVIEKYVGWIRNDLAKIAEITGLDCPVFVSIVLASTEFADYAKCSILNKSLGRLGFSFPLAYRESPEKTKEGFDWLGLLIGQKSYEFMMNQPENAKVNQNLVKAYWSFLSNKNVIAKNVESACLKLKKEFPLLRGCYLICQNESDVTFALPLYKTKKCKMLLEAESTSWNHNARWLSKKYILWSYSIFFSTMLILLPFWVYAILSRKPLGLGIVLPAIIGIMFLGWFFVFFFRRKIIPSVSVR